MIDIREVWVPTLCADGYERKQPWRQITFTQGAIECVRLYDIDGDEGEQIAHCVNHVQQIVDQVARG